MPYIAQDEYFTKEGTEAVDMGLHCLKPGELNFLVTKLCIGYLKGEHTYTKFNDIVGVLEAAKLEFYRRMVSVYEDHKKKQNGEVYPSLLLR